MCNTKSFMYFFDYGNCVIPVRYNRFCKRLQLIFPIILAVQIDFSVVAILLGCTFQSYWHMRLKLCQRVYTLG